MDCRARYGMAVEPRSPGFASMRRVRFINPSSSSAEYSALSPSLSPSRPTTSGCGEEKPFTILPVHRSNTLPRSGSATEGKASPSSSPRSPRLASLHRSSSTPGGVGDENGFANGHIPVEARVLMAVPPPAVPNGRANGSVASQSDSSHAPLLGRNALTFGRPALRRDMTVFTKADAGGEEKKPVPKVVVSPDPLAPSPSPPESENGDAPAEDNKRPMGPMFNPVAKPTHDLQFRQIGKKFYLPKKRSSSFGPLSIIRLSPSPLARTPSPNPLEMDNYHNAIRTRRHRCYLVFLMLAVFALSFVTGFYFHKHITRKTYHGWTSATYSDNGRSERLEQELEINTEENYEKIQVPKFGSNRPAVFVHDFKMNLTAIVDIIGKRCFVKELDRTTVSQPKNFIEALSKIEAGYVDSAPRVVRETFRVGTELSRQELVDLGSFMINRHCLFRPVYMLHRMNTDGGERHKRASQPEEALQFTVMGADSVEVDRIFF